MFMAASELLARFWNTVGMKPLTFTQAPNILGHNFKMLATESLCWCFCYVEKRLQKYSKLSTTPNGYQNLSPTLMSPSHNFTVNTDSVSSFLNSYSLLECSFVPSFFNEGKILNWPRFRTKYACISAKNLLEKYVMQIKVNFMQI